MYSYPRRISVEVQLSTYPGCRNGVGSLHPPRVQYISHAAPITVDVRVNAHMDGVGIRTTNRPFPHHRHMSGGISSAAPDSIYRVSSPEWVFTRYFFMFLFPQTSVHTYIKTCGVAIDVSVQPSSSLCVLTLLTEPCSQGCRHNGCCR